MRGVGGDDEHGLADGGEEDGEDGAAGGLADAALAPDESAVTRVSFKHRTGQTARVRYRYTGPVWSETGRYRSNSNLNSKNSVQPVRTGIPAGLNSNPNLKSHM